MSNNNEPNPRAKAVGNCPICGKVPDWFNDVPLRAFCWGTEDEPHDEASRVVPGDAQPYGRTGETHWKIRKDVVVDIEVE